MTSENFCVPSALRESDTTYCDAITPARAFVTTSPVKIVSPSVVPSLDSYRQPLREAFAACGVPLFLAESRPCARHPLCECLLTALNMLSRGAREEDLHACLASGCLDISRRDADRLRKKVAEQAEAEAAADEPVREELPVHGQDEPRENEERESAGEDGKDE